MVCHKAQYWDHYIAQLTDPVNNCYVNFSFMCNILQHMLHAPNFSVYNKRIAWIGVIIEDHLKESHLAELVRSCVISYLQFSFFSFDNGHTYEHYSALEQS